MSQFQQLISFVKEIMGDYPELNNWDGFELQDLAEKYGILLPEKVNKPCGEGCSCAEYSIDFEKGVTCYHLADFLTQPTTYTRPNLTTKERYDAEQDVKKLMNKYGGQITKVLAALCIENVRLVKEVNEHRATLGIDPLPTFEV